MYVRGKEINIGDKFGYWEIINCPEITTKNNSTFTCKCMKCKETIKLIKRNHLIKIKNVSACIKCLGKLDSYKGIISSVFNRIKKDAKKRNIPFEITIEDIGDKFEEQKGKCALSGVDLKLKTSQDDKNSTASLDRKESTKGYLKDNIQWVFRSINFMKGTLTDDIFINLCKKITEHQNKIKK